MHEPFSGVPARSGSATDLPPGLPTQGGASAALRAGRGSLSAVIHTDQKTLECDRCRKDEPLTEDEAEAAGWLVDAGVVPHKHFCPACKAILLA